MTDERPDLDSDLQPDSGETPADRQEPAAAAPPAATDPVTGREGDDDGHTVAAAAEEDERPSGEEAPEESASEDPAVAGAPAAEEVAEGSPDTPVADAGERDEAAAPAAAEAGQETTAPTAGDGAGTPASGATETPDPPPAADSTDTETEPPAAVDAAPEATQAKAAEEQPEDATPEPAKPEEPEDPALAELRQARAAETPVEGKVIGWNRGGFHVVVSGLTAFCPSSEMEVGRPKSPASYVEQTLPFKVIKVQKKGRRVVLSRAAILGEQRQQVIERLAPGTVTKGRITSLPDFGAFVDLGGVEGLVHVSEISRSRVQHPKDSLTLGQEVEVKVLKVEQAGERISLSMKDLEPDPWRGANERFGRGDRFSGKVLRRADFGLFVELEPEVEGLLHVSQLPPGKSFDDEAYQPGQAIEGWVREIEPKRQRISLSLREVPTEDPWKAIGQRFPEGESVEGVVESVAPFGVFIVLAPGVTGLLPNSQTGLPRGSNAARAFSPGQTVRVQVVSIDQRRKRISLGREGAHVEASKNDLQDFKRRENERVQEAPTAMAAAFARLRGDREDD